MQPPKPLCGHCDDTGSLDKTLWGGDLDCRHCATAKQRIALRRAIREAGADQFDAESLGWFCYLQGRQSRTLELRFLADATRQMWGWAMQVADQFTPGAQDTEKAQYKAQCKEAIVLAKKYIPANFAPKEPTEE